MRSEEDYVFHFEDDTVNVYDKNTSAHLGVLNDSGLEDSAERKRVTRNCWTWTANAHWVLVVQLALFAIAVGTQYALTFGFDWTLTMPTLQALARREGGAANGQLQTSVEKPANHLGIGVGMRSADYVFDAFGKVFAGLFFSWFLTEFLLRKDLNDDRTSFGWTFAKWDKKAAMLMEASADGRATKGTQEAQDRYACWRSCCARRTSFVSPDPNERMSPCLRVLVRGELRSYVASFRSRSIFFLRLLAILSIHALLLAQDPSYVTKPNGEVLPKGKIWSPDYAAGFVLVILNLILLWGVASAGRLRYYLIGSNVCFVRPLYIVAIYGLDYYYFSQHPDFSKGQTRSLALLAQRRGFLWLIYYLLPALCGLMNAFVFRLNVFELSQGAREARGAAEDMATRDSYVEEEDEDGDMDRTYDDEDLGDFVATSRASMAEMAGIGLSDVIDERDGAFEYDLEELDEKGNPIIAPPMSRKGRVLVYGSDGRPLYSGDSAAIPSDLSRLASEEPGSAISGSGFLGSPQQPQVRKAAKVMSVQPAYPTGLGGPAASGKFDAVVSLSANKGNKNAGPAGTARAEVGEAAERMSVGAIQSPYPTQNRRTQVQRSSAVFSMFSNPVRSISWFHFIFFFWVPALLVNAVVACVFTYAVREGESYAVVVGLGGYVNHLDPTAHKDRVAAAGAWWRDLAGAEEAGQQQLRQDSAGTPSSPRGWRENQALQFVYLTHAFGNEIALLIAFIVAKALVARKERETAAAVEQEKDAVEYELFAQAMERDRDTRLGPPKSAATAADPGSSTPKPLRLRGVAAANEAAGVKAGARYYAAKARKIDFELDSAGMPYVSAASSPDYFSARARGSAAMTYDEPASAAFPDSGAFTSFAGGAADNAGSSAGLYRGPGYSSAVKAQLITEMAHMEMAEDLQQVNLKEQGQQHLHAARASAALQERLTSNSVLNVIVEEHDMTEEDVLGGVGRLFAARTSSASDASARASAGEATPLLAVEPETTSRPTVSLPGKGNESQSINTVYESAFYLFAVIGMSQVRTTATLGLLVPFAFKTLNYDYDPTDYVVGFTNGRALDLLLELLLFAAFTSACCGCLPFTFKIFNASGNASDGRDKKSTSPARGAGSTRIRSVGSNRYRVLVTFATEFYKALAVLLLFGAVLLATLSWNWGDLSDREHWMGYYWHVGLPFSSGDLLFSPSQVFLYTFGIAGPVLVLWSYGWYSSMTTALVKEEVGERMCEFRCCTCAGGRKGCAGARKR
eukprot:g5226.t1